MKDVRIDSDGQLRCYNCGQSSFIEKRTLRAKTLGVAAVGIGALLTHKKLKCRVCGEYNQTGNAKPFTGPEGKKWKGQAQPAPATPVYDPRTAVTETREVVRQTPVTAKEIWAEGKLKRQAIREEAKRKREEKWGKK